MDLSPYLADDGSLRLIDLSQQPDGTFLYSPTPKQRELHLAESRFRLAAGGAGSGKSGFLLWEAARYLTNYPGCHALLLRKDFQELNKGLIQDLQDWIPKELYKYNANDHIASWFNGSKLFFGHCENLRIEDLNQYLSAAFSFIGLEEAGELPFVVFDFLKMRNRNRVEGPRPTIALATNPYGIGWGWLRKLFIEKKPLAQFERDSTYDAADYYFNHSTLLDNPHLIRKDPDYIRRLNSISDPYLRKKMLEGDLNAVSGTYFSNFSNVRHIITGAEIGERIRWETWQRPWIGTDWGLAHFWCTYWMRLAMVKRWNGEWKRSCVVYRELVDHEKSIEQYTKMIAEAIPENEEKPIHIFLSPERFNRTDPQHTPSDQFSSELRKHGLPTASRASNDRIAGATFIYSLFDSDELVVLGDACPNLVNAIPALIRDPKNIEDIQKAETLEDDCYDGFRYGILSMLNPKGKPAEIAMREHAMTIEDKVARHFYVAKQTRAIEQDTEAFKPKVLPPWMSRQ